MLKMLIKIDEDRLVKDDRYDLKNYWEVIDRKFKDNCTKEVLPDGSVLYGGIRGANYFPEIGAAYITLSEAEWFANYVTKWIWYDNDGMEDKPLYPIDIIARERKDNPLFQK